MPKSKEKWVPMATARRRRPARWICTTCQQQFAGRKLPDHEHSTLTPLCAYEPCSQTVRYAGRACCEEHSIRSTRVFCRLPDTMVGRGPQTGLSLFAARRGKYSRGELAHKLDIDWQRLYWIEIHDTDYSKEKWAKPLERLLAAPRADEVVTPAEPIDGVLEQGLADLQRVQDARKILNPLQVELLVFQFADSFLMSAREARRQRESSSSPPDRPSQ